MAEVKFVSTASKDHEYKNLSLQGGIVALQKLFSDEDKENGISIITKNNAEAEYPYISICGQHGYRRQKVRVLLTRNKGSTLFADGNTPNAIVIYNFWQEHRLIRSGCERIVTEVKFVSTASKDQYAKIVVEVKFVSTRRQNHNEKIVIPLDTFLGSCEAVFILS